MNDKKTAPAGAKPEDKKLEERQPEPWEIRMGEVARLVGNLIPVIKRALPSGSRTEPERFAQLCMTVIRTDFANQRNKEQALIWCSDFSLKRCIVQAAELDLQPGSALGQCWFIPYGGEATFQIGVWGYVALMRRSENVAEVWADVIYAGDTYAIRRGAHRDLVHEIDPTMTREKRGRVLGAYACVKYRDGFLDWEFVNNEDLELARATSKAPNSPAHKDWPDEMRKRTAIKRLAKYADKTPIANRAADLDEGDELRADLEEALKTITVQGTEITAQKSKLDELTSLARGLPAHNEGQSAREQLEGAQQRQGAEVVK
jgi:recombination protein RecT